MGQPASISSSGPAAAPPPPPPPSSTGPAQPNPTAAELAREQRTPAEALRSEPSALERLAAPEADEPPDPAAMNGATAAAVNGQQYGRAESLKPPPTPPTNAQRADAGFRAHQGPTATAGTPGVDNIVQSAADMVANAPPAQQAQVRNVVEHLGVGLNEGRLVANDSLRQMMHTAATADPASNAYAGAMNQLSRAADKLATVKLAPGTAMAFDPQPPQTPREALANQRTNGNPFTRGTGTEAEARLPKLDVALVDADQYYRQDNGVANKGVFQRSLEALGLSNRDRPLTIDSSKTTVHAFVKELDTAAQNPATDTQISRQQAWQQRGTPDAPREFKVSIGSADGFHKLVTPESIAQLRGMTNDPNARTITVGDRSYSVNELDAIRAARQPEVDARVAKASKSYTAADGTVDVAARNRAVATNFRAVHGDTAPAVIDGQPIGQARPPLQAPEALTAKGHGLPGARQGGLIGGASAAVVSTATALADGRVTAQEAKDIAVNTATGTALGAVSAKAEQVVTPAIQRAVAARAATSATAAAAPSLVPTLASRVAGSTVVGAVVSAGVSAYHNREGLKSGDSKAIGNVTADTVIGAAAVGAGAVAGAMATGALAGSVVPGVGTAIGAVVGLGIGVAITYGAQVTGARDWAAGKVADGVDAVKNAASSAWSGLKGVFS